MKVIHVSPASFGAKGLFGGGERYPLELARHMAKVTPTRLVTFGDESVKERHGELEVISIGKPWHVRGQSYNPFHPALLKELLWADVVHCHQRCVLASSLSAAFCRLTRRKVFVSDLGGGGWDISAYINTNSWYYKHLHISNYSRTVYGQAGLDRSEVIYGGVDTERFSPTETVPKEPLVVYVGRILPHKGINYLVDAIPEGLTLEIIGKPYDLEFFNDLQESAKGKPVLFRTNCDDQEIIRAYRRAACVVLPSVYKTLYGKETKVPELLGQTLLEGMACGTAAICTDVASMPEVVVDDVTGFVVPPNDSETLRERLLVLRDNPGRAIEMGKMGRERVLEKFTWPATVETCLRAYNS